MADISVQQKKGGDLTWIWAAASIIAIVALMAWLFSTRSTAGSSAIVAAPTDSAAVDTAAAAGGAAATDLTMIGSTPDQYVGQEVRVEEVPIAAVLGDRGFWAEIPGANPFLMIVTPDVADVSWLAQGDTVALQGTVQPVTEELVNQWVQAAQIREGASAEAAFATHYLEVTQAQP